MALWQACGDAPAPSGMIPSLILSVHHPASSQRLQPCTGLHGMSSLLLGVAVAALLCGGAAQGWPLLLLCCCSGRSQGPILVQCGTGQCAAAGRNLFTCSRCHGRRRRRPAGALPTWDCQLPGPCTYYNQSPTTLGCNRQPPECVPPAGSGQRCGARNANYRGEVLMLDENSLHYQGEAPSIQKGMMTCCDCCGSCAARTLACP